VTHALVKAAAGYIKHLDFSLVVAGADKVPNREFFPHGVKSATKSVSKLEQAILATPEATLAARVGQLLVLDADVRHGGIESLEKIKRTLGLPHTWMAETPTGGVHMWFNGTPFRCKGLLAKGVEVLRGNRLITLAPSQRAGGVYKWVNHPLRTPLAEPPDWLLREVRVDPAPERKSDSSEDPAVREKRARAWISKADSAIQGQHGSDRTIWVAVVVVRGFDLTKDTALSVMSEWNQRCDPPWSDFELKRKIEHAHDDGRMEWGHMLKPREERRAA
jgi:hypothetical protein